MMTPDDLFRDRIYAQYKIKNRRANEITGQREIKSNFCRWVDIHRNMLKSLAGNLDVIRCMYDVDKATEHRLDVLGCLAGIERPTIQLLDSDIESDSMFGRDQFNGNQFSAAFPELYEKASDDFYRILIKAKIFKNHAGTDHTSICNAIAFVTNAKARIFELELEYYIEFQSPISLQERYILENFDVLPRPLGVRFMRFEIKSEEVEFGRGQFNSAQFQES